MKILDDHGRVFGKVNIIDAAVLTVVCLLIPLAYGAYLLFRAPLPRIAAVEPSHVPPGTSQVTIRGEHLRPYLRLTIGPDQLGTPLLFKNPDVGEIRLPVLAPGSYDVALYDEGRELGRLRGGLVIDAPPTPPTPPTPQGELMAVGAFRGLTAGGARSLWRSPLGEAAAWGQVTGVQSPELRLRYLSPNALPVTDGTYQVGAVLRLRCALEQSDCSLQNVKLVPDATVPIAIPGGRFDFVIEELHPVYRSRVELLVRATLQPEVVAQIESRERSDWESFPARDALRPSVVSLDLSGAPTEGPRAAMVRVRIPVVKTPDGWRYGSRTLRLGNDFAFEGPLYQFHGLIVSVRAAR